MRPTQLLRVCALAVLAALAACSDGTSSEEPLATTYVLASVDGASAPLVIADHRTPGGVRQLYTMLYDSLEFSSTTVLHRSLRAMMESFDPSGARIPVLATGYSYPGRVTRRGDRLVVEYMAPAGTTVRPDTFTLRDANLVKMGPYGVACAGCAPVRRVEYVYAPADSADSPAN